MAKLTSFSRPVARVLVTFAISFSTLAVAACGSSSSTDTTSPSSADATTPSADTFYAAYAQAVCDDAAPCCSRANYTHDPAGCRTLVESQVRDFYTAAFGGGGRFDATRADQLVARIRKVVTSCEEPVKGSAEADAIAFDQFNVFRSTGSGAPGTPCTTINDCAPVADGVVSCAFGLEEAADGGLNVTAKGRCKVYRAARDGMSCNSERDSEMGNCGFNDYTGTGRDFYCDADAKVCRARAPLGATCSNTDQCAPGTRCLDRVCAALGMAGDRCGANSGNPLPLVLGLTECAAGLGCNTADVCEPLKAGGESCSQNEECLSRRCSAQRCAAVSILTAETCSGKPEK